MCNRTSKYEHVRDSVKGIIFFGTPHRGSNLAGLLSTLLTAAFSSRKYVDDLKKNGSLIELINEHFVQVSKNKSLEVVSFWESEDTRPRKVFLLISVLTLVPSNHGKDSAKRLGMDGFRGIDPIKWQSQYDRKISYK